MAGIAAGLGFLDSSNFVKYFTQRTDTTPAAFRTRFRHGRRTR
ncbi:hypothetical protein ABZ864_10430 [Streptomyces sp. NPDC047082]